MDVRPTGRVRPVWCVGLACLLAGAAIVATPQAQRTDVEPQGMSPQRLAALLDALRAGIPYIPGEVLVKFREGTPQAGRLTALAAARGAAVDDDTRWIGDMVRMRFPAERDAEELARVLRVQPEVEFAQPNYLLGVHQEPPPRPRPRNGPAPDAVPECPPRQESEAPPVCGSDDAGASEEQAAGEAQFEAEDVPEPKPTAAATRRHAQRDPCEPDQRCLSVPVVIAAPRQATAPAPAPQQQSVAAPARAGPRARPARSSQRPDAPITASHPGVVAEDEGLAPASTTFVPNDPFFSLQWNFELLDMRRAWAINRGADPNVVVAVIDTGITTVTQPLVFQNWNGSQIINASILFGVNPDLEASRLTDARDFVPLRPGVPVVDMLGHGTHIAGTLAQTTDNNLGVAGMAHRARVMPLKVCVGFWEVQFAWSAMGNPGRQDLLPDDRVACPTDAVAEALRYAADRGARAINLSLGGPGEAPALMNALRYAVNAGAFVAIAAGNSFEAGNAPDYPAAYAPQIDGVVAVGAVDRQSQRAYYSNTGPYLTLVAPGGSIRTGGTDGLIVQAGLLPADSDPDLVVSPRFDRYGLLGGQGTSLSAPHVAGLAALLISQGITRPAALEAAMTRFARDLGAPGHDPEYGYGLIQPRETLRGLGLTR